MVDIIQQSRYFIPFNCYKKLKYLIVQYKLTFPNLFTVKYKRSLNLTLGIERDNASRKW